MNKRGAYFFVIDAMIASSIIFLSLIIIFTTYSIIPETNPAVRMAEDYTEYLINTRIRPYDIPDTYIHNLTNDGNITNLDNTFLQQLTEFYFLNYSGQRNTTGIMASYIAEISKGVIPKQRSFAVYMNNDSLYAWIDMNQQEDAQLMIIAKKIAFKRINDTYIFGPVMLEVRIWI